MKRFLPKFDAKIWTNALIFLAIAGGLNRFGLGLLNGTRTNFFFDTLGITDAQVLQLEGIREIPGLALMFIAAFTMRLPLSRRAGVALLIAGIGYGLYATVGSYTGLLVMAILASLGVHLWMPLRSTLAMSLSPKERAGEVMGTLNGIDALAGIVGMAILALVAKLSANMPLGTYYIVGGSFIVVAALFIFRIPTDVGETQSAPPRMLLKSRYWLYYILTFFQGSRKQVLNTFALLVLVNTFDLQVWHISLILLSSSLLNTFGAPALGRVLDRFGERRTIAMSYVVLTLCCAGFAFIRNVWVLIFLLLTIKLTVTLGIGLSTYVYRIAPAEELTPTLSAGISINHVTSVGMPLIAGMLLPTIGYDGIFLWTAGLIALSIPFALAMKTEMASTMQAVTVAE